MTDITYSGSGTMGSQPGTITITVHPQAPPPPGPLFPQLFFNGAAFGVMNLGPSNWSTLVVSGTITLDITRWDANGPQPVTTLLMQWMVDNQPVGAPVAGPPIAFQLDTTTLADGTHFISGRVLDCTDPTGQLSAYQLNVGGVSVIVQNHGAVNGAQMVPVADHGGNDRMWPPFSGPASVCDFVHYPGMPVQETGIPYPFQHILPCYDPASPFHANPAALRDPNNWTTEPLLGQCSQEYSSLSFFNTTLRGGVGILGFSNQSALTVEGDYDIHGGAISRHSRDGGRGNAVIDAYSTLAENSSGVWEFLEIGGRFGTVGLDGTVTTLAGNRQDPSRLPLGSQEGIATDYYARKIVMSTGLTAVQWGGINDFVEDATNASVRYFANQIRHTIIKLDLTAGVASIYAGQDGVSGYVDGPRAVSAFSSPSSITSADGSNPALPAGTLIIADKRNAAIRLISPTGVVSTLAGGAVGPAPVSLATYNAGPAAYVPHNTRTFSAAYLPSPQTVDTFSNGSIMVFDDWSTQVLEVDPVARTVRWIATFAGANGQDFTSAYRNWGWAAVDAPAGQTIGACGPLDDIFFNVSDGYGAAELTWRASRDGTYSAGFVSDATPPWLGFGHYPWAEAVSATQGRFMSNGFANVGLFSHHIKQASDVFPPTQDPNYIAGEAIWQLGTVPGFPFGSRPSFSGMHGPQGHAWIGNFSVDEMQANYPTDAALATYIQAGMDGVVPRPEITGIFLSQLIYWIRRTATQSIAAPTYQFTLPAGYNTTLPVISNVAALRNGGVINVTWTTDRPTLGLAAAGTVHSFVTGWRYTTWSPIETGYGTSHSVTLVPPTPTNTHVAVIAMDGNGNQAASSDILIA